MIVTSPPVLPFAGFKWRWASGTPTEGLNEPPVYLGVLRAFKKFEGHNPGDLGLLSELAEVEKRTGTSVDLARTPDRNLIRNSGQYWKALGLLESSNPVIRLSALGHRLALGEVTMAEFAATTVATLTLPNPAVQSDSDDWRRYGIRIKPLELILAVLAGLFALGEKNAFLTKNELIKIVIPLSATARPVADFVDTLLAYRKGRLSIDSWPDCAPAANDHRMAAEFLLFLYNYGYCIRYESQFALVPQNIGAVTQLLKADLPGDLNQAASSIGKSGVADVVERERALREVMVRPGQARFRKEILESAGRRCVITATGVAAVLEAAHIVPVKDNGSDRGENGLCMRSDIHALFDSGHLRIEPGGTLHLSETARRDPVYRSLPEEVLIPSYVSKAYLQWRWDYL